MGGRSFCRIKNEQQEEKNRKGIRKKERSIELRVGLGVWDWLAGYAAFLVKRGIYRDSKDT